MATETRRVVAVLGMHRSGTSALTRGLKVLGIELGNELLGPFAGINEKGFWEDLPLVMLNAEMLAAVGSDWHRVKPIGASEVAQLERLGYVEKAAALLRTKTTHPAPFGFKDPRMAMLLPFWRKVFADHGFEVSYVLALRHPMSVAQSLAKRDGFVVEKSYLMWLVHVITSLVHSEGAARVIVDYDRLLEAPERELARVATALALSIDPLELESYSTDFLDRGFRHTQFSNADLRLEEVSPPLLREIFLALQEAACDNMPLDSPYFKELVRRWAEEFQRMTACFSLVDKLSHDIEQLNRTLAEREARLGTLAQAAA